VITQSVNGRLANTLSTAEKGAKLRILDVRSRSNSSTGLVLRSIDVLLFMCWVFIGLVISRPKKVYVSTNPPVVVPFVVFLYSKTFKAEYYYHLQDIHPEATNIVVDLNPLVTRFLRWIDGITIKNATKIITLSDDMCKSINNRVGKNIDINIVDNPGLLVDDESVKHGDSFVYCGNAGRLQRIPL